MDLLEDEVLTKQENFCETTGIFGVLISLTCLIQQVVFMNPHWITYCITAVYILSVIGFGLLIKKSTHAFLIIIVSSCLVLLLNVFFYLIIAFSLALLILFLYSLIIAIIFKAKDIQKMIERKAAFKKEEAEKWNNVI